MKTATIPQLKPRNEREQRALDLYARYEGMSPVGRNAIEKVLNLGGSPAQESEAESDYRLIDAARMAQREAGSFTKMHDTVKALNGLIELLYHVIEDADRKAINWSAINDSIEAMRAPLGVLYSATSQLSECEQEEVYVPTTAAVRRA
ncbi:MAG TPA: hypothetical protein VNT81_08050 [Vicinamibacterales bacterium]|nr:hypothetical protein [Vicinamibacterales bacterium]